MREIYSEDCGVSLSVSKFLPIPRKKPQVVTFLQHVKNLSHAANMLLATMSGYGTLFVALRFYFARFSLRQDRALFDSEPSGPSGE
jgi:hypothetical protein